jgi:ribosome-associated toxin RatA of RatAB toxin-antitoxin module
MAASLEVLKRDWFVLIPAIIYSLGFSLLSPNWILKENLSNAEMVQFEISLNYTSAIFGNNINLLRTLIY